MNTCKATLRVLFSHRAYLLIYLVFVGIMMLSISWSMLSGTSDSAAAAFEPAKMRVAVIDRDSDRGGIASSMRTYLSDSSELVNVDDASETLQQAVASNWVDLIVIIPMVSPTISLMPRRQARIHQEWTRSPAIRPAQARWPG